jgi:hypothetical protein
MPDEAWCVYNHMPSVQRDQLLAEGETLRLYAARFAHNRADFKSHDFLSTEEVANRRVDAVIFRGGGEYRWLGTGAPLNA